MADDLVDTAAFAAEFGVTLQTVWNWRAKGLAPRAHKIGRKLYFRRSDIERWLETKAEPIRSASSTEQVSA